MLDHGTLLALRQIFIRIFDHTFVFSCFCGAHDGGSAILTDEGYLAEAKRHHKQDTRP
jgi:hypothetical protein